jgi:hypothetical protein
VGEHSGETRQPHQFPLSAVNEDVIAWKCEACGVWVQEVGPLERDACPVDWRSTRNAAKCPVGEHVHRDGTRWPTGRSCGGDRSTVVFGRTEDQT